MQEQSPDAEERLPGGGVGGAVRIGRTVRRPVGPWTPTVHALLSHLVAEGLEGVPRPHGYDDQGREVLDFIEGDCAEFHDPWPDWAYGDELIGQAMRWLARYHRAVATFRPVDPVWRSGPRPIADDEIVCHNDFAPYNLIVRHDPLRLAGVIDWDVVAPGERVHDLAFAAWNFVPLVDVDANPPEEAARKLRLMAEAYDGEPTADDILDAVAPRIERALHTIRTGAANGDAGLQNLVDRGDVEFHEANIAKLRARLPAIQREL